ncbi:hypothetical protein [Streptomyces galbus]|uniref:Uncharacterized protein n=1 Tax=Streptomyces galbus TaxID=33898 RepID=A0A4U5X3R9_STRGB|nr:hypothetical protein [Streptomyces galbus]TKT09112.1 hypothetical protein E4U92_16210 [Streptomyces galbus]
MLVLDTGDGDEDYAEEQLQNLIAELSELDLDGIDRMRQGPPPPGSRSTDAVQWGALVLGLGGSGALLPVLAAVVQELQVADSGAVFTGRSCSTTVNRSTTADATALVRSPRWQSLRALLPGVQPAPVQPPGS